MSHGNVETLRQMDALRIAGDVDGALAFFHPEVEWRILGAEPPLPASGRGVESLRLLFEPGDRFLIVLPPPEIDEYVDAGKFVISVVRDEFGFDEAGITEFADGRIVRQTDGYSDKAAALEALGRLDARFGLDSRVNE